jgi:hypothetical protein
MNTTALSYHFADSVAVVQLALTESDTLDYISIGAALEAGKLEVREVSDSGSVNTLLVLNRADVPVFLMDGDILVGAKQNRIVNSSILLAPQSKTSIPVSCVEQGRWSYVSKGFQTPDYTAPTSLRSSKSSQILSSLRSSRMHMADQGEVWGRVEELRDSCDVSSPTGSLSDVYRTHKTGFETLVNSFEADPLANGLAVFHGAELLSLDLFNRKAVHCEYFKKILRGVALEIMYRKSTVPAVPEAEARFRAVDFVDRFDQVEHESFDGIALGTERRFDNGECAGFGLFVDSEVVHLTSLRSDTRTGKKHRPHPPID